MPSAGAAAARAAVAAAACLALVLLPGVAAAQGWPTEGGNPQRTASYAGGLNFPLGVAWSYATSGGISASPVIFDDVLYAGSWDGYLYALNATSGELLWRSQTGGQVFTAPTVDGSRVFVGNTHGTLTAFSRPGGAQLWQFDAGAAVTTSPLAFEDVVMVGDGDGGVWALDARTGNPMWRYPTGSPVAASPCYREGRVYAVTEDGWVWAFNAADGLLLQLVRLDAGVEHGPVASDAGVLVASGGCVYALAFDDLGVLWRYCLQGNASTGLAYSGHTACLATDDGVMRGLDTLHQYELWAYLFRSKPTSTPLATQNAVVWGTADGSLVAATPVTGSPLWQSHLGAPIWAAPVAHQGFLYVALQDGTVLCMASGYPPPTTPTATQTGETPTTSPGQNWTFPPATAHTELPAPSALVTAGSLMAAAGVLARRRRPR